METSIKLLVDYGLAVGIAILFLVFIFAILWRIYKLLPIIVKTTENAINNHYTTINDMTNVNNEARKEDRTVFTKALNDITEKFVLQLNNISEANHQTIKTIEKNHQQTIVKLNEIHDNIKTIHNKIQK